MLIRLLMVITALAGGLQTLAVRSAAAAADPCAAVLSVLHSTAAELASGPQPLRQLPTLAPGPNKTLNLDMTMERRDGIFVGRYEVDGVPVLTIKPGNGTAAHVFDPATEKNVPVPAECLARRELIYGGTLWKLSQGDRIVSRLTSKLDFAPGSVKPPNNGGVPCNTTNQHVHGMLVVPTQGDAARDKPYGDYIFDVTGPAGTTGLDTCMPPAPAALKAASFVDGHSHHTVFDKPMRFDIPIPPRKPPYGDFSFASGSHPSGLYWYHPHPHGYSRTQVNGGTTGLITVGDLCDYIRVDGRCLSPARVDVLDIALKDIQVSTAGAGKYRLASDYDATRCARPADTHYQGECPFDQGKWLFTVNGMLYPTLTATEGRPQVWRLANTSGNVTYLIRVVRRDADGSATPQRFRILSLDGVQAKTDIQDNAVHLMPSARVELLFDLKAGSYFLEQVGFDTGGDSWPAMDLATIAVNRPAPRSGALASSDLTALQIGKISEPAAAAAPAAAEARPALAPACTTRGTRHIYFVHQDGPPEIFGLLAAVRRESDHALVFFDQDGTPMESSAIDIYNRVKDLPHGIAFQSQPFGNVCTVLGREETWVLENWTTEDHNFHIHQSRFRLDPARPPQLPRIDVNAMTQRGAAPAKIARANAQNESRAMLERLYSPGGQYGESYHDNIPVPRGTDHDKDNGCDGTPDNANCTPGKVTITIRFNRQEQIGTFVYHCHILEHEDAGMMASVRVCDPAKRKGDAGADPACFPN